MPKGVSMTGRVGDFVGKIGGEGNSRQKQGYAKVCEHSTLGVGKYSPRASQLWEVFR